MNLSATSSCFFPIFLSAASGSVVRQGDRDSPIVSVPSGRLDSRRCCAEMQMMSRKRIGRCAWRPGFERASDYGGYLGNPDRHTVDDRVARRLVDQSSGIEPIAVDAG